RAAQQKLKKEVAPALLELERTADVLRVTQEARAPGMVAVGFALETEHALANARRKLREKALDLVVLNEAGRPGAGFEVETNQVVILGREEREEELPLLSKHEVAEAVLDRVEILLGARA
ncbi:MAG: phosphopantothenoylcysteine decarboxylase, partial [Gemmatimonadetes bacterium]|nr:phosphopantothenoylcysteine decarboxylase [Gemmatimonadota bacterium]